VFIANVVLNLARYQGIVNTSAYVLGDTAEPLIVAGLIKYYIGAAFRLDRLRHIIGLVLAAVAGCGALAIVLAAVFHYTSALPILMTWRDLTANDSIGVVLVAPLMIGLAAAIRQPPPWREVVEGTAVVALLLLASLIIIILLPQKPWDNFMPAAWLFPPLLWLAARCRPLFSAAGSFLVSITIIATTIFGIGHFGDATRSIPDRSSEAVSVMLFVGLSALILAALFAERRESEARLVRTNKMLQRVEAALRDSNNRLQSSLSDEEESKTRLADAMAAGQVMAFEWDAITGLSQRDNAARILGFERDGRSPCDDFFSRVDVDDFERLKKHIRELHPGNPTYALTFRFVRPDGHQVWLEETAQGEFDATGGLLRIKGLTRDITERKLAELALAERNLQFALAGKAGLVGSYAYDVNAELMQVSEGFAAIHGLPEGTTEMTLSQWWTRVHPEDLERVKKLRDQAFAELRKESNVEYRIRMRKPTHAWIGRAAREGWW
jgi:PAS domain S-box-containing protein